MIRDLRKWKKTTSYFSKYQLSMGRPTNQQHNKHIETFQTF